MNIYLIKKSGITLTEIILAMALLAVAFIPIIGVMGTSVKATDKDDRTIRAVNLCVEKMNQALQYPFGILEAGPDSVTVYNAANQPPASGNDENDIELIVGNQKIDGVDFTTELTVEDVEVEFNVPMYDPIERARPGNASEPANWGWTLEQKKYKGLYYRYTMRVTWQDKGSDKVKEYILASYKSGVRN